MATDRHAIKRSAHDINNSYLNSPSKSVKSKNQRLSNTPVKKIEKKCNEKTMEELYSMMEMMMTQMKKLDKLDVIEEKLQLFENELQGVKDSLNFVHAEVDELKKDGTAHKESAEELKSKVQMLESENTRLNNSVIDLKARSMRDNLLFFNIDEPTGEGKEDTTEIILALLEDKLEIPDARNKVKIDRSHRMGPKRRTQNGQQRQQSTNKPRPIVVKFNYFQDKENVLRNTKKLRGTRIGVQEQFPEEIERERKKLYPIMKEARQAGKHVRLARDKLYIDRHLYRPANS